MDKNTVAIFISAIVLLVLDSVVKANYFLVGLGKQSVFFVLLPLVILLLLGLKPQSHGLNLHDPMKVIRYSILASLLCLPVIFYFSTRPDFQNYYPTWKAWGIGPRQFLLAETANLLFMLNTEFFFRGFILFGMKRFGYWAIIIQDIPYVWVHVGKPGPEILFSAFAGVIFGYAAMKTKSIVPSLAAHWFIAVVFDLVIVYRLAIE